MNILSCQNYPNVIFVLRHCRFCTGYLSDIGDYITTYKAKNNSSTV